MLFVGDPAPTFAARTTFPRTPQLHLDHLAGRYIVLSFLGSAGHPVLQAAVQGLAAHRARFGQIDTLLLGVSIDPDDERLGRLARHEPGIEFIWDFDRAVSCLYGAARVDNPAYLPHTLILDRGMRVAAVIPFVEQRAGEHFADVVEALDRLPPLLSLGGFPPILQVPGVFEPEFCRHLIAVFEQHGDGGRDIGVLRNVNGQTVRVVNDPAKRRRDYEITDPALLAQVHERLRRRLSPAIKQAFQFNATDVERNLIGCYDAADRGHFRPHRDDATPASSHRRFAVTINLNAEDYVGGDLRFREFGLQPYRSRTGAATVFSCSLLHEVLPVERGRRYAFLPFMHDEAAAKLYRINRQAVEAASAGAA
jgi:peroxiredoxin/predicted 2-oxoglutarate/Fe(II)-dependent dioxygenase YbiX